MGEAQAKRPTRNQGDWAGRTGEQVCYPLSKFHLQRLFVSEKLVLDDVLCIRQGKPAGTSSTAHALFTWHPANQPYCLVPDTVGDRPPGTPEKILVHKQQGHGSGPSGWDKLVQTRDEPAEMPPIRPFIDL